ncbi:CoA transferase [Nocardia goodfellowii]
MRNLLAPRLVDTAANSRIVVDWLRELGPDPISLPEIDQFCPALGWASSGGMALTGPADGPPLLSPASSFGLIRAVVDAFADVTEQVGARVELDPATALFGRAGLSGFSRAGQRSAGGASRILRSADGWCAVTLSRPDDLAMVPAIIGAHDVGDPWAALRAAAQERPAVALAERAQLLGVPAAPLPDPLWSGFAPASTPWRLARIAPPQLANSLHDRLVVDLSSMWAGPLCGRLLGAAGARVVKVESTHRPDGARSGDPRFFDWLHSGQDFRRVDFRSASGQRELAGLLGDADIVIEASRPRALAQFGLGPGTRPHRAGQVWLSITGYGRRQPMHVGFGDDAAVAGGLVGWHRDEPMFCGDAIADPLTGLCGALAVAFAVRAGGGLLIDLSMRSTASTFADAPIISHGPHRLHRSGTGWVVECSELRDSRPVSAPPTVLAAGAAC